MPVHPDIIHILPHAKSGANDKIQFCCPCHDDNRQSAVAYPPRDGSTGLGGLSCSAGCSPKSIAAALNIDMRHWWRLANGHGPATTFGPNKPKAKSEAKPATEHIASNILTRLIADAAFRAAETSKLEELATRLGGTVRVATLVDHGVGWNDFDLGRTTPHGRLVREEHWTIPERAGESPEIIGICERYADGRKLATKGTRRGLVYSERADILSANSGLIIAPEGASDTLTFMSLNIAAIGRPSNTGGIEHLIDYFKPRIESNQSLKIVVMGENDQKSDGTWPGRTGALATATKLADATGATVYISYPPAEFKDVREWVSKIKPNFSDNESVVRSANAITSTILSTMTPVSPTLLELKPNGDSNHISSDADSLNTIALTLTKPAEDYENYFIATACDRSTVQCLKGIGPRVRERMFLCTRCGRSGCDACRPVKRTRQRDKVLDRNSSLVGNGLLVYEIKEETKNATIQRRCARAGESDCTIIRQVDGGSILLTRADLSDLHGEGLKVESHADLFRIITKAIALSPLTGKTVTTSYKLKRDSEKAKKTTEWEHIGQISGKRFHAIRNAMRADRLKEIMVKPESDKVQGSFCFEFPAHRTQEQIDGAMKWYMLGERPPSNGRMPGGWDFLEAYRSPYSVGVE